MRFCSCGGMFAPNGGKMLQCQRCSQRLRITPEVRASYTIVEHPRPRPQEVPVVENWTRIRPAQCVEVELAQDVLLDLLGVS